MSVAKALIGPLWRLGTFGGASDPTVVITGSPRSGTTWLLEMIERATDGRRIWEPFHSPNEKPDNRNFGLGWRPYLVPREIHPELKTGLERLLEGKGVTSQMATGSHRYSRYELARRLTSARTTILKFCRLQRLLPWFSSRFDARTVLLIRNPLAVVASQLEHPRWSQKIVASRHPVICDRICRDFPGLVEYSEGLESLEEKLAATWAFDYLVPLSSQLGENVRVLCYEDLVESPLSTLEESLDHLALPERIVARADSRAPSSTTRGDSNVAKGADPRTTWRRRLSEEQVGRVLSVVREFGFTVELGKNFRYRKITWSTA